MDWTEHKTSVSKTLLRYSVTGVIALFLVGSVASPGWAATTGDGTGSATVSAFVEISATDAAIAAFTATPSSSDPGPIVKSTADGLTFSNVFTNTRSFMSADVTSATDASSSATKTVQGTSHSIKEWIFVRGDSAANFGTYKKTGTLTADRSGWTTTGLTVDSGGTVAIKTYDATTPVDGGATTTMYWVYDATANQYRFDTDTDFTAGATLVNPTSKTGQSANYDISIGGNKYGVTSVGAATDYLPTLTMGWQADYSTAGSTTHDVYALIDFPSGVAAEAYSFTVTGTITQLTA